MKVAVKTLGNYSYLWFFNSKEVYLVKGFDTERKATNYAKKYGYEIFTELPSGIREYEYCN